jgi:hypothetical protein
MKGIYLDNIIILTRKFRHGHIQYGLARSKTLADYKAVSLNVMHASMKITDSTYSSLDNEEVKTRIDCLTQVNTKHQHGQEELLRAFQEFIEWKTSKNEEFNDV